MLKYIFDFKTFGTEQGQDTPGDVHYIAKSIGSPQ